MLLLTTSLEEVWLIAAGAWHLVGVLPNYCIGGGAAGERHLVGVVFLPQLLHSLWPWIG